MKVTLEDISETRKKAVVDVPAEAIDETEKSVLSALANQAKVPGFRPGKAPAHMVRQRFAKELSNELNRRLVSKAYEAVQAEDSLKVYSVVEMTGDTYTPGEATQTVFTVEIQPDFELPGYTELPVTIVPTAATEEEVDHAIEHLRRERADFKTVERAAEAGDYVKLSYEGTLDGQPLAELLPDQPIFGKQASTWEEAGSTEAPGVQAVIQGIIGMSAGDSKTVEEDFPEDFPLEPLRGKKVQYAIEVSEVRERELPPMDETFLKSFEVESEEQLRERIRDDIRSQKERQNENSRRAQVMDKLLAGLEFPLPDSALERETQTLLAQYMSRQMQQGASEEQFEENKEQLYTQAQQAAANRVRGQFVLLRIAEKEKIELQNEDLNQAIMQQAMATRQRPEDLVRDLKKDRNRLNELQRQVLLSKVLTWVSEQATVTEQTPELAASAS
ncbi:MAG: trigger factor [Opitutales bacterium]